MAALPDFDVNTKINQSPHVIILGAGASKAAFPNGDLNGRNVPLMNELVGVLDLEPLFRKEGIAAPSDDFESNYDEMVESGKYPSFIQEIESRCFEYFSSLELPDEVTIYDYLVLTLREKDIIATFNWDPFLALAWKRNSNAVKLPEIIFLHGNVEIGICRDHKIENFIGKKCSKCQKPLEPSRLLYTVAHKDYNSDSYIRGEWEKLKEVLRRAYYITFFGYSAPKTDIEARNLLLNTWIENPLFELGEIEIIDIRPREELRMTWKEFPCREHYKLLRTIYKSHLFRFPRRSCEALAMATLQNDPWIENPFPRYKDLSGLQEWIRVLWKEENSGRLSGDRTEVISKRLMK